MPINIYTPFRADEYAYQGGAALGAGIGGGLQRGAATFFEKMEKEKEKAKEEAKRSKAYDVIGEQLGFNKDKLVTMSLQEKEGLIKGTQLKEEMQARQQQQALVAQQIARMQAAEANEARASGFYSTLAARSRGEPSNAAMENYYENATDESQRPTGRPFNVSDIAASAAESGYNPGAGQFDDLIRAFGNRGGNAVPGTVVPVPGRPDLGFGIQSPSGSGSFLPLPSAKGKTPAPSYPWLLTDKLDDFKKGLRGIKDPAQRDAAIAARAAYNRALGTDDPFKKAMAELFGAKMEKPAEAKAVEEPSDFDFEYVPGEGLVDKRKKK